MLRKAVLFLILLAAALCAPTRLYAAPSCNLTVPNINFGSVDVLPGAAVNISGSVNLNCTGFGRNELDRFCISIGSGADFTGSQRQLGGSGSSKLNYDLYMDSAHAALWGSWQTSFDSAGLQIDFTSDGNGRIVTNVPIYARLFSSQQTAAAGSYSTTFPASIAGAYARFAKAGANSCNTGGSHAQGGFSVLATIVSTCNISATNVNFGSSGVVTSNIDVTSTVNPQCSNALPYTVSLGGGLTGASDPTKRKMAKGGEQITYGLYRDSARSQPWGSTVGTNTVAGTGTGLSQSITVYGRVPSQTTGSPGTYSDTIVLTVTY
jgi:spore coat protein U-like protein